MNVAIICEYNPFHNGHKYQIDCIRERFGADTRIVALMSGNYTQRGELAIADKYLRAEWAIRGGANLVIELPFPYSMACAEIFATSAISILTSLNVIDCLSFGSECGDTETLIEAAENMRDPLFSEAFLRLLTEEEHKGAGYPTLCEMAYRKAFGKLPTNGFFTSNDMLGIEYIKALKRVGSDMKLYVLKRVGASYDRSLILNGSEYQSARAIRASLTASPNEILPFIPESVREAFLSSLKKNKFPCNGERLSSAVISHFRLSHADGEKEIFDVGGGLYNRLKSASFEADSISSLIALAQTKNYTASRIRRAIWYSFFGVTSSEVKTAPLFTQILAFDEQGRELLKRIKERSDFSIITKPSASGELSEAAKAQKKLLDRADSVFQLTKPCHESGASSLRARPFVKK